MHSGLCTVVLEIGINCSAMLILCRNNIRVLQFISISSTVLFSSFPFMCLPCRKLHFFYYFIRCPSRLWFPDCLYTNTKKTLYCSLIFTLFALVTLICQFGFILALIALQTFIYHHYMPFLACPRGFRLSLYLVACFNISWLSLVILISLPLLAGTFSRWIQNCFQNQPCGGKSLNQWVL